MDERTYQYVAKKKEKKVTLLKFSHFSAWKSIKKIIYKKLTLYQLFFIFLFSCGVTSFFTTTSKMTFSYVNALLLLVIGILHLHIGWFNTKR